MAGRLPRRKMTKAQIEGFFATLAKASPEPETELNYSSPYTLLVAVVLSAQATDIGVNKATAKLFPIADTPEKMVALGEAGVAEYVKTIGLWRGKAKNVVALSQILLDQYDGHVPDDRDTLETLPGVGRKTANVVCNVVFGQPTIAVDTHIFRIGNRTGMAPGKTPLEVERGLEKSTPDTFIQHAHHWLILHGRYVCKARTPECYRCVVSQYCHYKDKTAEAGSTKKIKSGKPAKKKVTDKNERNPSSTRKRSKTVKKMATKPALRAGGKKSVKASTPSRKTNISNSKPAVKAK